MPLSDLDLDLDRDRVALLERLIPLIRDAGRLVMAVREQGFDVECKDDDSPVTIADQRAEKLIVAGLRALLPGTPVVAEEAAAEGHMPQVSERFWLVDPLDGTKEFIRGSPEFTVNIALVEAGRPVLGLVLAPALGRLFGGVEGQGAWVEDDAPIDQAAAGAETARRPIRVREVPAAGLTVVGSRWHGDDAAIAAFLAGRRIAEQRTIGSSLKLCLVAEGAADVYPRFGRTMEWDIAAGDAVLRAAGGRVLTADAEALAYGKPGFENPDLFAWGRVPPAA